MRLTALLFDPPRRAPHRMDCFKSLQYGPQMILQSDNGREFSGATMTAREHRCHVGLDPALLDQVIVELKQLWPDYRMVRGSPRHSKSNGGVERNNRAVQQFFSLLFFSLAFREKKRRQVNVSRKNNFVSSHAPSLCNSHIIPPLSILTMNVTSYGSGNPRLNKFKVEDDERTRRRHDERAA